MYPRVPIATKSRQISLSTTRANDDVKTEHGRLISVISAANDVHYRWSEDVLRGGDFEGFGSVWDKVNGEVDVEGALLRKGGPWREAGTVGAITLNKTNPLEGLRDALMALDDADTVLVQTSWFKLRAGVAYTLHALHKQSDAGSTIDLAIRYWDGAAYKYRTAVLSETDALAADLLINGLTLQVLDFAQLATDNATVTIWINGVATDLVEGTDWDAETTDEVTATNLAAAIDGLAGVTAAAVGDTVTITPAAGVWGTWGDETWLTLTDAATKTATNISFLPDVEANYEVAFKPTAAAASKTCQIDNVYFAEDALATDPTLQASQAMVMRTDGEGRFSFIKGASTGTAEVSEVG